MHINTQKPIHVYACIKIQIIHVYSFCNFKYNISSRFKIPSGNETH